MGESQYVMSLAHGACAGRSFDGVIASEVIEHVDGVPAFCAALAGLARPGGGVVISTISRTQRSYARGHPRRGVPAGAGAARHAPVGALHHPW